MRAALDQSIAGVTTALALTCWASVAVAQVKPRDPSSSALGESPGASGAVSFGRAPAGTDAVIPVGPGPSYPRVPRGITHPTEPFGARPSNPGIEPLTPLSETRSALTAGLGIVPGAGRRAPPTTLDRPATSAGEPEQDPEESHGPALLHRIGKVAGRETGGETTPATSISAWSHDGGGRFMGRTPRVEGNGRRS